jgi:hypothetical protein
MLKTVAEQGAGNVAVVLQGVLRDQGGKHWLESAGFQVNVKQVTTSSATPGPNSDVPTPIPTPRPA